MRTLAVATAIAALSIAAPAFADAPSQTPNQTVTTASWEPPPPAASPDRYIDVGAVLGGYDQFLIVGAAVEGGARIGDSPLWLHGSLSSGAATEFFANGSGMFLRATVGLEARGCVAHGRLCVIAGGDVGVVHAEFNGMDTLFSDGDTITDTADHVLAIPRLGIDAGNTGLHVRWMLEVPLDLGGIDNGGGGGIMTLGIAEEW